MDRRKHRTALILNSETFTEKEIQRLMSLVVNAETIYTDNSFKIYIKNDYMDDTTLYNNISYIKPYIKEILNNRYYDDRFILKIIVARPVSRATTNFILDLVTEFNDRISIMFEIILRNDKTTLSVVDYIRNYTKEKSLVSPFIFYNVKLIADESNMESLNEYSILLTNYNINDYFITPVLTENDSFYTKLIEFYEKELVRSNVASIISKIIFDYNYPCKAGNSEFHIFFNENTPYYSYCANQCSLSTNITFIDDEHSFKQIKEAKDLYEMFYFTLPKEDLIPGYISCPLQNKSKFIQEANALMNKLKILTYNRFNSKI